MCHVREWNLLELVDMLSDQRLSPVFGSYMCNAITRCPSYYNEENNLLASGMVVIENDLLKKNFETMAPSTFIKLHIVIHVVSKTSKSIAEYICHLVSKISDSITILLPEGSDFENDCVTKRYIRYKEGDINNVLVKKLYHNTNIGDWFMIQDSNEIVQSPSVTTEQHNGLLEYLAKVDLDPQGFNAVASSIIFQHDVNGNLFSSKLSNGEKIPFKIYNTALWDTWNKEKNNIIFPECDPFQGTVRIWKRTVFQPTFTVIKTGLGHHIIGGVAFAKRSIYPYHIFRLRLHPTSDVKINEIGILYNMKLRLMYNSYIFIGYWESHREHVVSRDMIY